MKAVQGNKEVLERIAEAIPRLSKHDQYYVLGYAEAMAGIAEDSSKDSATAFSDGMSAGMVGGG